MIKKFLNLIFKDAGMLVGAVITAILSAAFLPAFIQQLNNELVSSLFLNVVLGIFAIGFYASSALTTIILSIKTGLEKKWLIFTLATLLIIADVIILIINLF